MKRLQERMGDLRMDRQRASDLISAKLGARRLIWIGYHGLDALPLTELPQFTHCYSFGSPLGDPRILDFSVEQRFGLRQLDRSSWVNTLAYRAIGETLLPACEDPSYLATFTPGPMFEAIERERPSARYLGVPWERFELFNSKVYVEGQLQRFAGDSIDFIEWRMLPNGQSRTDLVRAELERHPVVLRVSSSQAGMGHELIRDTEELAASRLMSRESVAMGPFLEDHVPLNVAGCLFPDGEVTLHSPSMQLVGLPHSVRSRFGFCGSDFSAIKEVDRALIERLETYARIVGKWLHSEGYVGAFGMDAMVYQGQLFFTELNPRFQGSTRLLNAIDAELDTADIVQDHLLAWLGAESHPSPSLVDLVAAQPDRAQVLVFNRHDRRARVTVQDGTLPEGVHAELTPREGVLVDPMEVACSLVFNRRVTTSGRGLDGAVTATVNLVLENVEPLGRPPRRRAGGAPQ